MRPELVFLLSFVYLEQKIVLFCGVKCNFELKFSKKNFNSQKLR